MSCDSTANIKLLLCVQMLKVKDRQRLHEIEQEVHRELSVTPSQCHQSPGEVYSYFSIP